MINNLDGYIGGGGALPNPRLELEIDLETGRMSLESSKEAIKSISNPAYVKYGVITLAEWRATALATMSQVGDGAFFQEFIEHAKNMMEGEGAKAEMDRLLEDTARFRAAGLSPEQLLDNIIKSDVGGLLF